MVANDLSLYRYISFDRFIQMLFSQELVLIHPSKWDDSYELYWKHYFETGTGRAQLDEYVKQFGGDERKHAETAIGLCRFRYDRAFCLCFSRENDSEVLWNARADNNRGIMFATTRSKIYDLFSDEEDVIIKEVQYDLESTQPQTFLSSFQFAPGWALHENPDELLLHKRKIFSYEKEVRLILSPDEKPEDPILKYPIPDLSTFIDGVMVHPLASDAYVSSIKLLCEHFNIPFWGRSEVYSFKLL